jgi:4-hydroxybutyrate dehydrogenase
MKFSVHTEITSYDSFKQFADAEQLKASDLIITNEFIYDPFIKPCKVPCQVLFQERYGSGEPNDQMIDAIRAAIPEQSDRIIAIGGGTVIDIGKTLIFNGSYTTEQLFTGVVSPEKVRSLIVVPTTCGTGSEVTNLTIVELKALKTKKGLGLTSMFPDKAALIPEMVKTLPYKFFATSSIDALIHAIESMVSPKSSLHTEVFAQKAVQQILRGYQAIVANGLDTWPQLAESFLTASNFAGIAFGNAGVGAVHALSYPLGGAYHIPHGEANQLMFIGVFKAYQAKQPIGKINLIEQQIADLLAVPRNEALDALDHLLQQVLPRKPLREYGITQEELAVFSKSVIEGQQRLLANNYVPLTEPEILNIYQQCY